jgi:hypothetical protein
LHNEGKKKKPTNKGSIAEAVNTVESQLNEKYMGFKKAAAAGKNLGEDALDFLRSPEGIAKNRDKQARSEQDFADRSAKHFASQVGDQYHDQLMKNSPSYADEYRSRAKDTSYDKLDKLAKSLQAKHDPMGGPTNIDYEKIKKNPMTTKAGEQGSDWRPFGPGPKDSFDSDKFGRPVKEGNEESNTTRKVIPVGVIDGPGGYEEAQKRIKDYEAGKINKDARPAEKPKTKAVEESGLQAYLGKKKYGEQGMKALQKAGREGASKEKMAKIRARHDKMDEGAYNEDMLSPKEKEFAALAEPKDKITYADKIAGAKKGVKKEGNKFSGNLIKARAQGLKKADLDGDGDMEPVRESAFAVADEEHQAAIQKMQIGKLLMREGWEEMQKYLEKKRGPESKGGAGKKAGTRYGGSAQKDDDEDTDGEGKPVEKKKGRPKGTGGGAKFNFKKPKD